MSTGRGNIITGFIEGAIVTNPSTGTPVLLPFADKIGSATFRYMSESLKVETFSQQGIKGASAACPFREECSIELGSENLAWSFMQAATNTIAQATDVPVQLSTSAVLTTTTGTGASERSTLVLPGVVVSALGSVRAANEEGEQFAVTATVTGPDTTITFPGPSVMTGQKVTVFYSVAASGTGNLIKLGSGTKLGEVGVYGRFFGCPDTYIIAIPRGIIDANLELSVGDNPGSASLTVTALRNNAGDFAYIRKI